MRCTEHDKKNITCMADYEICRGICRGIQPARFAIGGVGRSPASQGPKWEIYTFRKPSQIIKYFIFGIATNDQMFSYWANIIDRSILFSIAIVFVD